LERKEKVNESIGEFNDDIRPQEFQFVFPYIESDSEDSTEFVKAPKKKKKKKSRKKLKSTSPKKPP